MQTRRNRLIKPGTLTGGGGPPSGKTRNITLKELSEHRVLVPPELAETGMSLVILVGLNGQLQPGLVPSGDVPIPKPIQDLSRLQRARAVVSSLDVAASKTSVITEVKEQVISAALSNGIDANKVELKFGAQSELIRSKTLSLTLIENRELFSSCPQNKAAVYKATATKWFDSTLESLNTYVLDTQCCNRNKDLNTILLENHVPKWFFNKFTGGKVQELATNSIDDIFFPKKLSRMITFSEREVTNMKFIDESVDFKNQLITLDKIATLYPSKEKDAILYPLPNDYSRRFSTFTDLPQIDRTVQQSSILSLTLIHMVFCAIPLKALTVENLQLHLDSLVFEGGSKVVYDGKTDISSYFELAVKESKAPDRFRFVPEMSTSPKVQYKDFLNTEGMSKIIGFKFLEPLYRIFNITEKEVKTLAPGLVFDCITGAIISPVQDTIFKLYPPEVAMNKKREQYNAAFSMLKPSQPKELNFGMANSPLSRESDRFLKHLTDAGFNNVFLQNLKKYLQSFNNPVFQAQAIKIMHATIQARTVTLTEPPDESSTSDVEDTANPYLNLG